LHTEERVCENRWMNPSKPRFPLHLNLLSRGRSQAACGSCPLFSSAAAYHAYPYHRSFSSLLDRTFLTGMDGATFGLVHLTIVSLSLLSRNEERDDLVVCTEHQTPTSRHQSRYLSLSIVGVSNRSVKGNETTLSPCEKKKMMKRIGKDDDHKRKRRNDFNFCGK